MSDIWAIPRFKTATSAAWAAADPILRSGQPGWDSTLEKGKIGDGETVWSELGWSIPSAAELAALIAGGGVGGGSLAPIATSGSASDLTGGTIPAARLPALAITNVFPVANQAAMLALTAETGDFAVRADNGRSYALSVEPASTLGNWLEISAPGAVTSVAGRTGVITLAIADIASLQTALDDKEPLRTTVAQAEAEAGTATTVRGWTAQRVAQAIAGYIAANVAGIKTLLGVTPLPYTWSASTATTATGATARVSAAQTLAEARMRAATAPVGSALTVVVQRSTNGGSTWSDLVTLSIAAGSTTEAVQTVTTALSVGDLLRPNATSVGSTTAATGVSVEVYPA